MKTYNIGNHTIEFGSGSSSLDPWSADYCREIAVSVMSTSDLTSYVIVDGERIYRLRNSRKRLNLINALEEGSIETWEELCYIFDGVFDNFVGNLSEIKKELDEFKKECISNH